MGLNKRKKLPRDFTPNVWRTDEEVQWFAFYRGERDTPPEGRTLRAARRHLKIPALRSCSATQRHAMATAAARYLPKVHYTGQGCHSLFLEDALRIAIRPEALASKAWDNGVFLAAVKDARRALFATLSQPLSPAVDRATEGR